MAPIVPSCPVSDLESLLVSRLRGQRQSVETFRVFSRPFCRLIASGEQEIQGPFSFTTPNTQTRETRSIT